MCPNSVSSIDGFGKIFYILCWDIIEPNLGTSIYEFFIVNHLPMAWNATFLSSILKIKLP